VELSSFVGREREIAAVEGLLLADGGTRLLTLIGPGGCGKMRLALAAAAGVADGFEDGVWWVGLAALSEPDLVPLAVARALSVGEQPGVPLPDALAGSLREKKMLLVLDNCEHLIASCARFAQAMLTSCPRLRILTTSREPLGVPGETRRMVPPLSAPDDDAGGAPPRDLARYEAVSLFVERARSRLPGFELTARDAWAVAEVCRRLEGIPLAIELAAARVRALSVEQILERLENPLKLLTASGRTADPRHRTLRATLRWGYDLLAEKEQKLFGWLSVFAGGGTLEAAEAVGAGEGIEEEDVLDLLSGLVDKSMVVAEASPGARMCCATGCSSRSGSTGWSVSKRTGRPSGHAKGTRGTT
jgi:predicted ATPase